MSERANWRRVLEKNAAAGAIVGAISFLVFWSSALLDFRLPWAASLPVHALTIATLAAAIVGLQLRQSGDSLAWVGWVGTFVTLMGLVTLLELLIMGLLVFAVASAVSKASARTGGSLVAVGSGLFNATVLTGSQFWSEGSPKPTSSATVVFAAALVLIAGGVAWLGISVGRDSVTADGDGVQTQH